MNWRNLCRSAAEQRSRRSVTISAFPAQFWRAGVISIQLECILRALRVSRPMRFIRRPNMIAPDRRGEFADSTEKFSAPPPGRGAGRPLRSMEENCSTKWLSAPLIARFRPPSNTDQATLSLSRRPIGALRPSRSSRLSGATRKRQRRGPNHFQRLSVVPCLVRNRPPLINVASLFVFGDGSAADGPASPHVEC